VPPATNQTVNWKSELNQLGQFRLRVNLTGKLPVATPISVCYVFIYDMSNQANKEQLSLDAATRHILEECRMVLPGIQALFGFQLIAVFNEGFAKNLSPVEQKLHLASIVLTVCAVALIMTPAALHRQIDPLTVSRRFIKSGTILLLLSMFPLGISICLEIYLIAHIITGVFWLSLFIAAGLFLLFLSLWIVLPHLKSGR
jgi:Family of unknown function (DUF6328)